MKKLSAISWACETAKALKKPCMYINISYSYDDIEKYDPKQIILAAPYLSFEDDTQLISDNYGLLVFETEEERDEAFWQTVGPDGPTKTNKYDGPCSIYALTIDSDGITQNENT